MDSVFGKVIAIIGIVALILFLPIMVLWSLNILVGTVYPLALFTNEWFAMVVLLLIIPSSTSSRNK